MPASGKAPIQLYRSTTPAAAPAAGDMTDGELALNYADGKLYYKDSGGTVKLIAANLLPVANGGTGAATLTGIVKANGTSAFAAATAGADYVTPTGTETLTNKTITNPTITNFVETTATSTGDTTINLTDGTIFKVTTNGNNTVTLPSSVTGKSFVVIIAYTGAHTITWAGGSTLKWLSGTAPTQTKVNGKFDIFTFLQDGTNTYGSAYGLGF